MQRTAITGSAAIAAAVAFMLSACGPDTKTEPAAASSTSTRAATSAKGPNQTIATYIAENSIQERPVKRGDPGSPTIDLPVPDGWETAGDDTPDWAYSAIVYTGPKGKEYAPSIVALVSKLTGKVDPQKILDLAPGELQNLPGWKAANKGAPSTLGRYPAYQLGGTWTQDGQTKVVAQKTVVIPAGDGLYVLQLNTDGLEDQAEMVGAATDVIDAQTKITA